jgi:energy-coupling factor transporter ATP-binding protein EcfA2
MSILNSERASRRLIRSIHVEGLHGKFKHDIDMTPAGAVGSDLPTVMEAVSAERLTLLYGKNGTGKTSLLRLLFHALSGADDRGHRNALRRTRFALFEVRLTDGSVVRYTRESPGEPGAFSGDISVATPHGLVERSHIFFGPAPLDFGDPDDPGTALRWEHATSQSENEFVEALADLGINPVFLRDSRVITSDVLEKEQTGDVVQRMILAQQGGPQVERGEDPTRGQRERDVREALDRVRAYLSQLAFSGAQQGSMRVDTVYANVARAIIQSSPSPAVDDHQLLPPLRQRVGTLASRAKRFYRYGLLPESPMPALADLLALASEEHGPVLVQVLSPYLDGFEQRLEALEPGLQEVAAFVDTLNVFLEDKEVQFSITSRSIAIRDRVTNEDVDVVNLSSGEKQIVLLFSDIVSLQGVTRLFIIDEPELSLNPQWQRSLMPSLLELTQASSMQLIAATHSIEIMARFRDRRRML